MQPGHAEIAGAGFGGLAAAIALAQRGWSVRVHERRGTLRGEGYGIAIHRNLAHIFASFGILDAVLAGGMRIDRRDSLDRRGTVVMSRRTERSPYRIDRQHNLALPHLGPVENFVRRRVQIGFLQRLANRDALRKLYRYIIHDGEVPSPFLRRYACHTRRRLDASAMARAAEVLRGRHDFRSFETEWPNRASSVRTTVRSATGDGAVSNSE